MDKKAASLLSLCMRAGKLASGEFSCEKALSGGTAKLIIIAADASDNTRKKFVNKAYYYKVPTVMCENRDEISKAIGKENRVVAAILDENFADGLQKLMQVDMEVGGCLR